jgi:hypothetical protein
MLLRGMRLHWRQHGTALAVPPRHERSVMRRVASPSNIPYQSRRKTFDELSSGVCVAPSVTVDNAASKHATKLTVEAVNYPGVLRVIAWVLNGLQVRVQSAQLLSQGDTASDTFLLVDLQGRKVRAPRAPACAGRSSGAAPCCGPPQPPCPPQRPLHAALPPCHGALPNRTCLRACRPHAAVRQSRGRGG